MPQTGITDLAEVAASPGTREARAGIAARLEHAIFVSLCMLAFCAPQYIKPYNFAFAVALLLWLIKLLIVGRKFYPQPLVLPSLLFLLTAGIASALSYVPVQSWERMSSFVLLPAAFVVAQNVKSMRQVKILVFLVLLSGTLSALRTGWQYAYGIGTRVEGVPENSLLFRDGVRSGDLIQVINGHKTRSLGQWRETLQETRNDTKLKLQLARQAPVYPLVTYFDLSIDRKDLEQWLRLPGGHVERGRPLRAQGHLDHFVRYAGVLMELASLAFGLLITTPAGRNRLRWLLAMTFVTLLAALFATVTRTYVIGLFLGCALQVWLFRRKFRRLAIAGLALCLLAAAVWVKEERGPVWFSAGDRFRFEIWKESLHLIPHHPLFGVGLDAVNLYGRQWGIQAFREFDFTAHFHSTYVQLAVDCGLPCLAAWVWLLAAYLLFLKRSWMASQDWEPFARGALLGIFASVAVLVMASAVAYTLADSEVVAVAWLFMGVAMALPRIQQSRSRPDVHTDSSAF